MATDDARVAALLRARADWVEVSGEGCTPVQKIDAELAELGYTGEAAQPSEAPADEAPAPAGREPAPAPVAEPRRQAPKGRTAGPSRDKT